MRDFVELLISYDQANVIGTQDAAEVLGEHVVDSLSCMQVPAFSDARTVVDVGSGAGLPGIPLAIVNQNKNFTLVDSVGKKTTFQRLAISRLGLGNIVSVKKRIEEAGRDDLHRERYDLVTCRALASLDVLMEYCLPLVRVGGSVISMKGRLEKSELQRGETAAKRLGGTIREIHSVERLESQTSKERQLVVVEKVRRTPVRYPRDVGVPAKKPLGDEPS
ncbi:MAG: 16S rRNA (guanine(527)-N(7))-methyltransferase RsmG [Rubrobacter sp.]